MEPKAFDGGKIESITYENFKGPFRFKRCISLVVKCGR
jgi:hypothetical protein